MFYLRHCCIGVSCWRLTALKWRSHRMARHEIKRKSMRFNQRSEMKCWCGCWSAASAVSPGDDRTGPRRREQRWSDYGSAAERMTWPELRAARRLSRASTLIWTISPWCDVRVRFENLLTLLCVVLRSIVAAFILQSKSLSVLWLFSAWSDFSYLRCFVSPSVLVKCSCNSHWEFNLRNLDILF